MAYSLNNPEVFQQKNDHGTLPEKWQPRRCTLKARRRSLTVIVPILLLSILVAYFGASLLRWVPNRMARSFQTAWTAILGCALVLNVVVYKQGGWTWPTDLGIFLLALALVLSLYRYGAGFRPVRLLRLAAYRPLAPVSGHPLPSQFSVPAPAVELLIAQQSGRTGQSSGSVH